MITGDLESKIDRPWDAFWSGAFYAYLTGRTFGADQLRFVQLIAEQLTTNGVVEVARLYESPFTDAAARGPEQIFTEAQVDDLCTILNRVRDAALPDVAVA